MTRPPRILTIAGSDPSGGAGIQADLKTITVLGGYGMSALTALTAQNTEGVSGVHPVPAEFVKAQIVAVLSDIGADAIKTGMLANRDVAVVVAEAMARHPDIPVIVDPVMVAKGGARLLDNAAMGVLKADIIRHARLVTPNAPEAEVLVGFPVHTLDDARHAVDCLVTLGADAVLLKGGHLATPRVHDFLFDGERLHVFESERLDGRHTHGTGCTLAAAIATLLGKGERLVTAVEKAILFVHEAIAGAPGFGRGNGPIDHLHPLRR